MNSTLPLSPRPADRPAELASGRHPPSFACSWGGFRELPFLKKDPLLIFPLTSRVSLRLFVGPGGPSSVVGEEYVLGLVGGGS